MVKVNELFAGIGAFRKALINLNIPHEIVGISEIDKYAIKSYEAMYGETRNYGDISEVERLDYADLWTYGFPCQDISLAGDMKGIVKGKTRSGLLHEVERLLEVAKEEGTLPKFLIMENVKNLVSKKFIGDFQRWIDKLSDLGYTTEWKTLIASDYGIPQRRERVFAVSVRNDRGGTASRNLCRLKRNSEIYWRKKSRKSISCEKKHSSTLKITLKSARVRNLDLDFSRLLGKIVK